jgi:hypothetical protein
MTRSISFGRTAARARRGTLSTLPAARTRQHADDLIADLLRVGVEVGEDACSDALVLPHQAEQDVLGADVVVSQRQRLAQGQLEHLLRTRGERNLPRRDLLARTHDPNHLVANLFDRDLESFEYTRGEALLFTQQSQQDVLRADVVVLESACLFLGQDNDLAGTFGEAFKHRAMPSLSTVARGGRQVREAGANRASGSGLCDK